MENSIINAVSSSLGDLDGKTLGVLGLSFLRGINENGNDNNSNIIEKLQEKNAFIKLFDSRSIDNAKRLFNGEIKYCQNIYDLTAQADALIITTERKEFEDIDFEKVKQNLNQPLVIDEQCCLNKKLMSHLGFKYITLVDQQNIDFSILIPCYNEEEGIRKVISGIPTEELKRLGYNSEIIVIDNNSIDKTSKVAKVFGAKVISEKKQGKAYALIRGINEAKGEFVVTIDGDCSYPPGEISKLVERLNGEDLIVGSRFESILKLNKIFLPRELSFPRVFANKVGALLGSIILGHGITDVTTGLRVFRKDLLNKIPEIKAKNLDFEAEFTSRVISNKLKYNEVKIDINCRMGMSSLQYFRDAFRFLFAMIRGKYSK